MIGTSGTINFDDAPLRIAGPQEGNHRIALGSLTISADVRLDNKAELTRKLKQAGSLESPGIQNPTISDDHLVLAAYQKWGADCVDHLLGDFAFVICDPKQQRLFAARDHLGVRPFFYFHSKNVFVFGCSALAVAALPKVSSDLNREKLAGFLLQTLRIVDRTESWFKHIHRLPPAHAMVVDRTGLRKRRYWQLDPGAELLLPSDDEYTDAFEELLDLAVRDRLAGTGTTASMLSGGIDSSTIVGLASREPAKVGAQPFPTYSGISDESDCIESGYIRKVIAHCRVEPSLTRPSELCVNEEGLDQADRFSTDPADHVWSLLMLLFLRAKADGHSVMLSGVDGDQVAALGPDYPAYLVRSGYFRQGARELQGLHRHYFRRRKPTFGDYWTLFRRAVAPTTLRRLKVAATATGLLQEMMERSLISGSLADSVDLRGRLQRYLESQGHYLSPSLRHSHMMQIDDPYLSGAAELYGRVASIFGMECRHPLLDKRLVEFCVSLPWNQKFRDGWSKYAMRRVAARVLPREVAWRPGFEQISWKFTAARSRLQREQELECVPELARAYKGLVNPGKVERRLAQLRSKEVQYDQQIMELLSLGRWLRRLGIDRF